MAANTQLALCEAPIQLSGSAVLGVHSNVVGDGNDYTAGHAWISVRTASETYYFGLWPDGHPRVNNHKEECSDVRMGIEAGYQTRVSRYYALDSGQVMLLNRFLNRPSAWALRNTCAAWAVDLLKEVVGVKFTAIDYAFFSTPRELGKELMKLEKLRPTNANDPQIGVFEQAASSNWL